LVGTFGSPAAVVKLVRLEGSIALCVSQAGCSGQIARSLEPRVTGVDDGEVGHDRTDAEHDFDTDDAAGQHLPRPAGTPSIR
jgi:hypothetical protein